MFEGNYGLTGHANPFGERLQGHLVDPPPKNGIQIEIVSGLAEV